MIKKPEKRKVGVSRGTKKNGQDNTEPDHRFFNAMADGYAHCKMIHEKGQVQDWVFIAVNDSFEKITGLKGVEGKRVTEIAPDIRKTHAGVWETCERVSTSGQPEKVDIFMESRGTWCSVSLFSPGKEQIAAIFSVITQSKEVETKLRESAEYFRTVANFTYDWEYWLDSNRQILYTSPSCERITGYEVEKFEQDPSLLEKIIHPDDLPEYKRHCQEEVGKTEPLALDFRIIAASGETLWINHACQRVYGADGRPMGRRASNRDVTQRRQMEQALRENESILNMSEEVSQTGSWRLDLRTKKTAWSDQMFHLFGAKREDFDGDMKRVIAERVHPDDAVAVQEFNRSMLKGISSVASLTFRVVLPDGTERTVRTHGKLVRDNAGRPISMTGYVQEVTEWVRVKNQFRQMQRLYTTLSQINQTIARVKDAAELYHDICSVIVKHGEFSAAWIELLDEPSGELRPVAASGLDLKKWMLPIVNINGEPDQNRLVFEALHASKVASSDNIQSDERAKNLYKYLAKFEFHSLASIPFQLKGKMLGILNLASTEAGMFKESEEISLIEEMGRDINFALEKIENEKVTRRWVDAFEHCAHGIAIVLPTGQVLTCNPVFARLQGRTVEEVSSMHILDMYDPAMHEHVRQGIEHADRVGRAQYEARMIRKDGSVYPVQMDLVSVRDENGDLLYRVAAQQDITARKQAEEALLQNERRYRLMFENNPLPMWIYDVQTLKFIAVNDAAMHKYGYTREEFTSMDITDVRLPEDVERFVNMKPRMRAVMMHSGEWRHRLKDGTLIDVEVLSHVFLKEQQAVLVVVLDITARKRAEFALRDSEEKMRSIFRVAPTGIGIVKDRMLVDVNDRVCEMTGYSKEEIIGQSARILYPSQEEFDFVGREKYRQISEKGTGQVETRWQKKDGSLIDILLASTPIDVANNSKGVTFTALDITDRKQAEEALRESEDKFKYIFDNSTVAKSITTLNGTLHANRTFCEMVGYSQQELENKPWRELTHPDDVELNLRELDEILAGKKEAARFIKRYFHKNGSTVWVDLNTSLRRDINGKPLYFVTTALDITERKQAEQALLAAEEKYRNIFENAVEAITQTTPDGKYISANPATARMLGYDSPEDLIASVNDIERQFYVRPGRREEFLELMKQHGQISGFESEVYRKDGSRIWVVENSRSVYDDEGRLFYFEGAAQEITDRKLAEIEIQRHTEDLLLINALNSAANRGEDIAGITRVFAGEARSIFDCRMATVFVLSADGKHLEMQGNTLSRKTTERIEKLIGRAIPKVRIPLREDGYFKKILSTEEGLITSDPLVIQNWIMECAETVFLPQAARTAILKIVPQIHKVLNIVSTISIPLVNSGRVFGLLSMSSRRQFTEDDLRRIGVISHQITAVILRKQAEVQVRLQMERIRALSEIDRAISSSLDMRLSLDILLNQVISQLGVDATDVLLLNPSSQTLEYEAGKGFRSLGIRETRSLLGQGHAGWVGMERKILHIPDISATERQVLRAELLKDEKFVEYVGVPLVAKGMLKGVLEVFNREPLTPDMEWIGYLEVLGGQAAIAIDNAQLFEGMQRSNLELVTAYDATIAGWSRAMDLRDKETEGHTLRVTEATVKLAKKMGVSQQELTHMRRGALLHDIGKLGVPDHILNKPDKLDKLEWAIMRQHPTYAFNMLMSINYLRPSLDIPYCHHERWDGGGYPRSLRGEEIPLAARIFAVVDVWDALRSDRPYRAGWDDEKVRQYLIEESGKHFDPQVVAAFLHLIEKNEL